ncbi:hypothetical protein TERMP_00295 [Thermococcus barophilus MP]|uniref:Nucleic acid-binding protein n=2 Tax=Thermococcus barophilus TaxID=55802 RepID=F0LIJ8_THEBM|nr:hypothetical protein TERMP_00295 [Thermococcus barophilus MP]
MPIISDTSPLILLKKTGGIYLLEELFNEVVIPLQVQKELYVREEHYFSRIKFLKVQNPKKELFKILLLTLDEGEAGAIALAIEHGLPLLIDDLKGRKTAKQLGLKYIGTLGILKIAKNRKIISEVRPFIEKLLRSGYYISPKLVEKFLREMEEF